MAGARRQIFMAFSVFLLVEKFQFSIKEVTILFVINNIIGYFISPLIGRAIIRFGERKILSLEYASLIVIFIAYAVVDSKTVMGVLYILDHIFFGFFDRHSDLLPEGRRSARHCPQHGGGVYHQPYCGGRAARDRRAALGGRLPDTFFRWGRPGPDILCRSPKDSHSNSDRVCGITDLTDLP